MGKIFSLCTTCMDTQGLRREAQPGMGHIVDGIACARESFEWSHPAAKALSGPVASFNVQRREELVGGCERWPGLPCFSKRDSLLARGGFPSCDPCKVADVAYSTKILRRSWDGARLRCQRFRNKPPDTESGRRTCCGNHMAGMSPSLAYIVQAPAAQQFLVLQGYEDLTRIRPRLTAMLRGNAVAAERILARKVVQLSWFSRHGDKGPM